MSADRQIAIHLYDTTGLANHRDMGRSMRNMIRGKRWKGKEDLIPESVDLEDARADQEFYEQVAERDEAEVAGLGLDKK